MSDAINPVDWFEIPVNDIARATAFYQRALGVTLKPMEQGPMKMAWFTGQPGGSGANGMLVQGPGRTPSKTGTLVYFTVPEIDADRKSTRLNSSHVSISYAVFCLKKKKTKKKYRKNNTR